MKNPGIVLTLAFQLADFTQEKFQKHWNVFRDGQMCKFLVIYMDRRVEQLRLQLEQAKPDETQKIQGQIIEAKKLKFFLEQKDVSAEIGSVREYVGM